MRIDPETGRLIIFAAFDYDGTTGLDWKRRKHVEKRPKDYEAYHREAGNDEPNQPIIEIMKALVDQGHRVEIWTGREERYRQPSEQWLEKYLGAHAARIRLRMRPTGTNRDTNEVKEEWAREPENWPDIVFDDRNKTTQHWRELGILCAQVAENA